MVGKYHETMRSSEMRVRGMLSPTMSLVFKIHRHDISGWTFVFRTLPLACHFLCIREGGLRAERWKGVNFAEISSNLHPHSQVSVA